MEAYRSLLSPERTREAFAASEFVSRVWPRSVFDETQAHFRLQGIFNDSYYGSNQERRFEDLHLVLTQSRLRTLPVILMKSSPRLQTIASGAAAAGVRAGGVSLHLGIGAMADRDYPAAARHFADARTREPARTNAGLYEALALGLAGNKSEGLRLISSLTAGRAEATPPDGRAWLTRYLSDDDS
jgi:hypothetical protein